MNTRVITRLTPKLWRVCGKQSNNIFCPNRLLGPSTLLRTVVYINDGQVRLRGLTTSDGRVPNKYGTGPRPSTSYNTEIKQSMIESVRKLLSSDITLPDPVIIQVLTHKSFNHGLEPYNESLARIGLSFLRFFIMDFITSHPTSLPSSFPGRSVDALNSTTARNLERKDTLARYAKLNGLADSMRWVKRHQDISDPALTGEKSVASETVQALIGAIVLHNGAKAAKQFTTDRVIDGHQGLLDIALKLYSSSASRSSN